MVTMVSVHFPESLMLKSEILPLKMQFLYAAAIFC